MTGQEKPPASAEEAIEAYERLRAKNEAKQEQDLHARISLTAGIEIDPNNKQILRRSLYPKIEIDVPSDKADCLDALHRTQATINIVIGEFMAAHLLDTKKPDMLGVQAPPKPIEPYSDLGWRDGPYGFFLSGRTPSDFQGKAKELYMELLNAPGQTRVIMGKRYSLNTSSKEGRVYINRTEIGKAEEKK